jgi:hypothetical protein
MVRQPTCGRRSRRVASNPRPDELERRLRDRLDALGPAPRAELLHVLMLPDFDRADRIGEFWGSPGESRLRRVTDRLRRGSDASGGARWDCCERPTAIGEGPG